MRGIIYSLLLFFILCSCKHSEIKLSFSNSDSLVIYFKNEQKGIITKTIQTTDAKAINRVIGFIDGRPAATFTCGYDGKMFFFSDGKKIQEVDFNIKQKDCIRFSLMVNGKLISTKIKSEAVDFLEAQEKGLPFY